jgi:multiple sugar transport system substrate-binding protein
VKKSTVMLVSAFSVLFSLSAWSAPAKVTLPFWNSWTGSDGDLLAEMVDEFNKTNKDGITIKMDVMPSKTMNEKLAPALVAGTAAPLILYSTAVKYTFGAEGKLVDLSDIFAKTRLRKDDFDPTVLSLGEYKGKQYFIPFQACAFYMFWNKSLFKKAGLDPTTPPATWAKWAEYASKMTDPASNTYGSGLSYGAYYPMMSMLQCYGGEFIAEDGKGGYKSNMLNPGYANGLRLFKNLIDSKDNPLDTNTDAMFSAGKLGLTISGPWLIAGAKANSVDYGVALLPAGDAGVKLPMFGAGLAVTNCGTQEQRDAAYKFIEWWMLGNEKTKKTGVKRWSTEIGFPAFLKSLSKDPEYAANRDISVMGSYGPYATLLYPNSFWIQAQFTNDIMIPLLESVAFGKASAADALAKADKQTKELFLKMK